MILNCFIAFGDPTADIDWHTRSPFSSILETITVEISLALNKIQLLGAAPCERPARPRSGRGRGLSQRPSQIQPQADSAHGRLSLSPRQTQPQPDSENQPESAPARVSPSQSQRDSAGLSGSQWGSAGVSGTQPPSKPKPFARGESREGVELLGFLVAR